MQIRTHRHYDKMWAKLNVKDQQRVIAAVRLYLAEPKHPKLRSHTLKGKYFPQYSISAGGDLRVHLLIDESAKAIVLMSVGTHSQLYVLDLHRTSSLSDGLSSSAEVFLSDDNVPEGTLSEEKAVLCPGSLSEGTGILCKSSV
jgi:mRNA-degrading endonuclease YafQ of YafQ-DinJ toxin-antitoxin module